MKTRTILAACLATSLFSSAIAANGYLHLDGSSGYMTLPKALPDAASFSFECKFRTSQVADLASSTDEYLFGVNPGGVLFSDLDQSPGNDLILAIASNAIYAQSKNPNNIAWRTANISSNWHHIAYVFSAGIGNEGYIQVYLDGELIAFERPSTPTANVGYHNGTPAVGVAKHPSAWESVYPPKNFFQGDLDEVRYWNRALTGEEIKNNFNGSRTPSESGLLYYYKFDDAAATDSTGNGYTGSLVGGATIEAGDSLIVADPEPQPQIITQTVIVHDNAAIFKKLRSLNKDLGEALREREIKPIKRKINNVQKQIDNIIK